MEAGARSIRDSGLKSGRRSFSIFHILAILASTGIRRLKLTGLAMARRPGTGTGLAPSGLVWVIGWAMVGVQAENASLASPSGLTLLTRACQSVYPLSELASDFQSCQNISAFNNDKSDLRSVFHYGTCQAVELHLQLLCRGASPDLKAQTPVSLSDIRAYQSDQVCRDLKASVPAIDCERVHLILGLTLVECQKHEKLRQILDDHPPVCSGFCRPAHANGSVTLTPLCGHLYFTSRRLRQALPQFLLQGMAPSERPAVSVGSGLVIPPKMMPHQRTSNASLPGPDQVESAHVIDSRKHAELPLNPSQPEVPEPNPGEIGDKMDPLQSALPDASPVQVQEPPVVQVGQASHSTTTERVLSSLPVVTKSGEDIPVPKPADPDQSQDSSHYAKEKFRTFHEGESQSQAFSYLILFLIMGLVFYLVFHNKKKILALALEGRQGRQSGGRQRHRGARYHKLDNNLEEAMGSNSSDSMRQIIY
ncbi:hypothetical protein TCAL_14877 [Tigriopus californicus]|uniref:Uncharacterized protein n=1 Tax=Tigriopus californicus TaxID=6832 RepID=A0A553P1U5_TIGCA|nr:uncharacterized protein LOC131884203 [Tigriopus californicus]TRY71630.1 hypothetical protein TCAL_14877 [Tigriopus californicus]